VSRHLNGRDGPAPWPRRAWHQRFRHSLRWRLVGLFLLLALGTTLIVLGGMRAAFGTGWKEFGRPLVNDYLDRLAGEIGTPPDVDKARALTQRLPISVRIDGPVVRWDSHPGRRRHDQDRGWDSGDDGWPPERTTADGHTIRFGMGDWGRGPRSLTLAMLIALLLLTLAAYATVRRLFRPLDDIRAGAIRFGRGDLAQPIPVRRRDELGELAHQVNTMASELGGMLEGQRALLLAISHELRSPLTRARLHAELVAEGESRDALLHELSLMRDLISDLLESERLQRGQGALQRELTDLNALVREVVNSRFEGQPLELKLAQGLAPLALDRVRIGLLVRNLIDNALRHGEGATHAPELSTEEAGGAVLMRVRDHGPGVAEEHLAQLAQPFFRPDTSRTRSAGGVGLGLTLCRLVARSHGGELRFRNAHPGLEVEVQLPRH
jgi:signal transduction histidine kinase